MFLRVLDGEARNARPNAARRAQFEATYIEVRMFHVGHGEAILIDFDGERAWLIDGGCSNGDPRNRRLGELIVEYLEDRNLTLEALIPSHPHKDHAGAIATILNSGSSSIPASITLYRSDDASWHLDRVWLGEFWDAIVEADVEVALRNARREIAVTPDITAVFFAGSGDGPYTSLFLQLRYHDARLLFTGDAHCGYEVELLDRFGAEDFRGDVLKVTHHGSSSGTAIRALEATRPGIAIVSTGEDGGHRLERDTKDRLLEFEVDGEIRPRRVFETVVDGDIVVRTDGVPYRDGVLYEVLVDENPIDNPGMYAQDLDAEVLTMAVVDAERTTSHHPACD